MADQDSNSNNSDDLDLDQEYQNISVFRQRKNNETREQDIESETYKKMKSMLSCPICLDIFKDPVYVKVCSHRFCKDCIEKAIRQGKKKNCPTCRKNIGTKRILRIDNNISELATLLVGNVTQYIQQQEEFEKKELENRYEFINQQSKIKKRVRNVRSEQDDDMLDDDFQKGVQIPGLDIQNSQKKTRRKRKKINPIQEIQNLQQEIPEEQQEDEFKEEDLDIDHEDIQNLQKLIADHPEFLTNIDTFINVQLTVLPTDELVKIIKKQIIRTKDKTPLQAIQIMICRKLNLKDTKYHNRVKLWVKHDEKYIQLENSETLKSINEKYWKYQEDLEVYDIYDFFHQILEKNIKLPNGEQRILFYSFDFENL